MPEPEVARAPHEPTHRRDHGPREDLGNPQLLESLDATNNVDQRIPRPDLVQGDVGGRKAMHSPLRLAQQGEGPHGTLPHPGGQWRALDHRDQLANVAM